MHAIPWEDIAVFLTNIPNRGTVYVHQKIKTERILLLTNGLQAVPRRRVYPQYGQGWFERGFWNKDADTPHDYLGRCARSRGYPGPGYGRDY